MTPHDLVDGYRTFVDVEELAVVPTGEYAPTTAIFTVSDSTTVTSTITN
ncbi:MULTISPECIES: LxmA leader domain family RiPP [Streptomyces]|nr:MULTISPECIES: LxmA leader domain family RiPP [Streptomyces]MCH0558114.1 LxmA leader domain family RiPP [Streptomyces sp. MUM 16J]